MKCDIELFCFSTISISIYLTRGDCGEKGNKASLKAVVLQYQFHTDLALVVQRPDNFIRWIRYSSASKIYFTLNVVQGFRTFSN